MAFPATVVDDMIRQERADCRLLDTTSSWFGVTYPEDEPHVGESIARLVARGGHPSPLA